MAIRFFGKCKFSVYISKLDVSQNVGNLNNFYFFHEFHKIQSFLNFPNIIQYMGNFQSQHEYAGTGENCNNYPHTILF